MSRLCGYGLSLLTFLWLLIVPISVAHAETQIPVTSSAEGAGSFRAAIAAANGATEPVTVTFNAGLNITLTSGDVQYTNAQPLTLVGNNSTLRGNGSERILVVSSAAAPGLRIEDLTLENGVAPTGTNGGGAISATGAIEVFRSTFLGNAVGGTAPGDIGGAIQSGNGDVRVVDSTFSFNSADTGGAIHGSGVVEVVGSTFTENVATSLGGAVVAANVRAINSTFANNAAGTGGGAISAGQAFLTFVTIGHNSGSSQVSLAGGATPDLQTFGTVISSPDGGANCSVKDTSSIETSSTYSYDTDGSCGFVDRSDTGNGTDPLLGALADNGGPTLTMLPSANSPLISAIRKGACKKARISVDQRGQLRPQGRGCEIGAVEVIG